MTGRVLYRKVLIRPFPVDEKTKGGIIKPTREPKPEDIVRGTVIKVGEGFLTKDGNFVPLRVKPGDVVHYHQNSVLPIELDGEKYAILGSDEQVMYVEGG